MKTKCWLIFGLSTLAAISVRAQNDAPPRPILQVVSIDPATNDVSMKWEHHLNPSYLLDYYTPQILEYPRIQAIAANCQIGTIIPYPSTNIIIPNATTASCIRPPGETLGAILNTAPQGFALTATSTVPASNASEPSDYHFPSCLIASVDPCRAQAVLKWTKYKITNANLEIPPSSLLPYNDSIEYEVWGYEGNPPFNQASAVKLSDRIKDTTFVSATLTKNRENFFFIKVFLPQGNYLPSEEISYSNRASAMYTGPAVPTYINTPKIEAKEDAVELSFDIDPVSELLTYHIERTTDVSQGFSVIYEFTDRTQNSYIDYDITPSQQYFYRISAIRCDSYVKHSDVISTIILSSRFQPNNTNLGWLAASKPGSTYSIVRIIPDNTVITSGLSNTNYTDNILPLIRQGYDKFYYQIVGTAPNGDVSISMPNYIIVEPPVYMPNALDPTQTYTNTSSGAQRNRFAPIVDMNTTAYGYMLTVFNRWGTVIYETKKAIGTPLTADHYWDGTYKNKLVEPGLYLYAITVYFPSSQVSLKGDISVFY